MLSRLHFLGKSGNFKKYSVRYIDNLGEPYNYGSVMHYGRTYFTKNRKPTIETLKPGVSSGDHFRAVIILELVQVLRGLISGGRGTLPGEKCDLKCVNRH